MREGVGNQRRYRRARLRRVTEMAGEKACKPGKELHEQRLIDAHFLPDGDNLRLRKAQCWVAKARHHGVGRQRGKQEEGHRVCHEQHHECLPDAGS